MEDKEVWIIEVPSGPQKPYTLSGSIFVRQGPNTQKITSVEHMRDFFQQADRIYFHENSCPGFNASDDIDTEFFEEFRTLAHLSTSVNREQILSNLKITFNDGKFKNGGVLFFGENPETFFEKAVVRCLAFEGETSLRLSMIKSSGEL